MNRATSVLTLLLASTLYTPALGQDRPITSGRSLSDSLPLSNGKLVPLVGSAEIAASSSGSNP